MDTSWLDTLSDDIWKWFRQVQRSGSPGQIEYCLEGAVYKPGPQAGLGMSSLMLKTLYMLDRVKDLGSEEKDLWISFIKSFQQPSGYFKDNSIHGGRDVPTLRAETRQACAALRSAGALPTYAMEFAPQTKEGVLRYLNSLNWQTPWAAGSHTSHLVVFLHLNESLFAKKKEHEETVFEFLDGIQHPETGTWYGKPTSTQQMINGAMKVLTAYEFAGRDFRHAESMIDFALSLASNEDGCNNVDVVYVMHQCSQVTDHRKDDIRAFCEKRLDIVKQFRKPDGGFSFLPHGSGNNYYGVSMSKSRPVSDVHGTSLLMWTTLMLANMLEIKHEWNIPIT